MFLIYEECEHSRTYGSQLLWSTGNNCYEHFSTTFLFLVMSLFQLFEATIILLGHTTVLILKHCGQG